MYRWIRIRGENGWLISGGRSDPARVMTEEGYEHIAAYYREGGPGDEKRMPRRVEGRGSTRAQARASARRIISRYDPSPDLVEGA